MNEHELAYVHAFMTDGWLAEFLVPIFENALINLISR
jgi:hypothetical protein